MSKVTELIEEARQQEAEAEAMKARGPRKGPGRRPKKEEEVEAAPQMPQARDAMMAAMVMQLMEQVSELKRRLEDAKARAASIEALPPPLPPRAARRHIRVMKDPFTVIRVEVPEDYDGPGADGEIVQGYLNHERTLLRA